MCIRDRPTNQEITRAYPTEARERQKVALKAARDAGIEVRKQRKFLEDHYDDCGEDLSGLGEAPSQSGNRSAGAPSEPTECEVTVCLAYSSEDEDDDECGSCAIVFDNNTFGTTLQSWWLLGSDRSGGLGDAGPYAEIASNVASLV